MELWCPARGVAAGALALAVLAAGCANVATQPPPQPLALDRLVVTASGAGWVLAPAEAHTQVLYGGAVAGKLDWRLVTPPGVSTRGGLAGAFAGQADALVGVFAHGTLAFSPLALTNNGGRTWLPELLPGALVRSPEALSLTRSGLARALLTRSVPAGTAPAGGGDGAAPGGGGDGAAPGGGGEGAAPGGGGRPSVVASSDSGASWSTLAGFPSLAATAREAGCTLAALTGVQVSASGATTVLGSCHTPGRAVLLTQGQPAGRWRASALVPPSAAPGTAVQPLWVAGLAAPSRAGGSAATVGSGAGLPAGTPSGRAVALLVQDRRGAAVVVGTHRAAAAASGAWTWSTPLPLGPRASAPEIGVSPQGTWWVLPAPGTAARRLAVLTTGGTWSKWTLPGGTVEAAGLAGDGVALSVVLRARQFTILTRGPGPHRSWAARARVALIS